MHKIERDLGQSIQLADLEPLSSFDQTPSSPNGCTVIDVVQPSSPPPSSFVMPTSPVEPIVYEGLLRRKKVPHLQFEDPYKNICVCRLQGSTLRLRRTEHGEVVGSEERFDLHHNWRVVVRQDKPDRFTLHPIHNAANPIPSQPIFFKAFSKETASGLFASLAWALHVRLTVLFVYLQQVPSN